MLFHFIGVHQTTYVHICVYLHYYYSHSVHQNTHIFISLTTTAAAAVIPIILNYFMRHHWVNKANLKSMSFSLESSKSLTAKHRSGLYQIWSFSPVHSVLVPQVRQRYTTGIYKPSFSIRGTQGYFDQTYSSRH